ncbi:MAG: hypothetical protein RLZ62_1090 [Bacteroidota bacterium]
MKRMMLSLPRFTKQHGALAQLVEQWTENPCVPSSILGGTTLKSRGSSFGIFCLWEIPYLYSPDAALFAFLKLFFMPEDIVIRVLLLPVSLIYGLVVGLRNLLYRSGILRSVRFDLPVISVGNLAVGGTGKSPHIEYMIRWLDQYINVAVLSRGYGRKTIGFRAVSTIDSAAEAGDEPLQFKRKFPGIPVSVSESRALGVPEVVKRNPDTQCVLLDDAFQHLAVTPLMHIMLTEYGRLFTRDWLMPSGRLREWKSGYRRADIIIVTKCPPDLDPEQRRKIIREIDPYPRQRVYFSRYHYGQPYDLLRPDIRRQLDLDTDVLLLSAIANADYLLQYMGSVCRSVHTAEYADHHFFREDDMHDILKRFQRIGSRNKIVVTTEKDATRLEAFSDFFFSNGIPVFVLPVQVEFCDNDEDVFRHDVKRVLEDFKV